MMNVAWAGAIARSMEPSGRTVDSYVLSHYPAFVRVMNPSRTLGGTRPWAAYARTWNRNASDVQWADVIGAQRHDVVQPRTGSVDPIVVRALARVLPAPHGRIVVAQWEGYADTVHPASACRVHLPPARASRVWESSFPELAGMARTPMRWWHPGLDWMVGNDVYARSVFVGGAVELVDEILASKLEAYAVSPNDPVGAEDL